MNKLNNFFYIPLLGLFLTGHVLSSEAAFEIIQPRADLDTTNRFYKAYPDLEYNVRLAVVGGEYPYNFELVSGPEGMHINNQGVIEWPSPAKQAEPYETTVEVTDQDGKVRAVTWPITVTTRGFRFLDAVNGTPAREGGTGSHDNPWKSMVDFHKNSRTNADYRGEFLYWREGTYPVDTLTNDHGHGPEVDFYEDYKPMVWLRYPGDARPRIDLAKASIYLTLGHNAYFDDLEFDNNGNESNWGFRIASRGNNVTFRRNIFQGITTGFTGGNSAHIFIRRWGQGDFWAIQDNEFTDVNVGYGVLGYFAQNVLVSDNTFQDIGSHAVGPKQGTQKWHIRANHFSDNPRESIAIHYSNARGGVQTGDIWVSYNLVELGGGKVLINQSLSNEGLPIHFFRNTFLGSVEQRRVTSTNGPFHWNDNVIVNNSTSKDQIDTSSILDTSRFIVRDNLTGKPEDNIVDQNGMLTGRYLDYVGKVGHESDIIPDLRPKPPQSVITIEH